MPRTAHVPLLASGVVMLAPDMGPFNAARLTVSLEDISRADAPSQVIAGHIVEPLSYDGRRQVGVPFELRSLAQVTASLLSVRAHLRFHPGSDIERGDWVTMRTYPIRSPYPHQDIEVFLHKVR